MSNPKTKDKSQSGRTRAYERLTPESAVLLLIDHQSGLVSGIRDLAPDGAPQCSRVRPRRACPRRPGRAHIDCANDVGPDSA